MGIYSDGKRVGYSHNSITEKDGVKDVIKESKLSIDILGSKQEVDINAHWGLNGYEIQRFSYDLISPTGKLSAPGIRNGNSIEITITTVSGQRSLQFPMEGEYIIIPLIPKWLAEKGLETGKSYSVTAFDPASILMGIPPEKFKSTHTIGPEVLVDIPGAKNLKAFRVESKLLDTEYTTWITKEGNVLKQTVPPGLIAVKEKKRDILGGGIVEYDLAAKTSIPSNMKLDNARSISYMQIYIKGINDGDGLDVKDNYRQFTSGNLLEIKSNNLNNIKSLTLPINGDKYAPYLESTALIQSDDPEINAKTKEIIKGESDSLRASQKINDWIYYNLKKEGTISIPNAKDVLKTMSGDCNEHATLFTAMARSAGIPTKIALGLIYIDGRFYYHAWNEVYVGRWIAVDPAYGQLPADATHIKFIEGDLTNSSEISKLVGKINIEITDAS